MFALPAKMEIVGNSIFIYEFDDQYTPLPVYYGRDELKDETIVWQIII